MRYLLPVAISSAILAGIVIYSAGYTADVHATGPQPEQLPIADLKPSAIQDTFNYARAGGRRHEATDILAPRGTPVHSVCDGVIQKLFLSHAGGNTIYEFDRPQEYCYYYAHLDRYADGLKEGQEVHRGDVIGYVGATGNADPNTPHLHFAIFKLGPAKHWWEGTPIDPYPILEKLASGS